MTSQPLTRALRGALAAALLLAAAVAPLSAAPVAGVVVSLEGRPQSKTGSGSYKRMKLNQIVHEGDLVKTDKGERVGIAFVGGAELRINERSEFEIQSGGGAKPVTVKTRLGDVWTRLIGKHSGIHIRTPAAVAAVRGTECDVNVNERVDVKVYDGHVDLTNEKGTTALRAGQQASVAGAGEAPSAAQAMAKSDYGTWQNGLQPVDLNKSLELLNKAADKSRTLELEMKDKDGQSKKVKLNFEKK
ncbi:MAG: FecR family protein [Elusimicrobiota bacterium]|nr:FecR family protein [Elusimicrobiota bacterium]